jgi:hypothetical protein
MIALSFSTCSNAFFIEEDCCRHNQDREDKQQKDVDKGVGDIPVDEKDEQRIDNEKTDAHESEKTSGLSFFDQLHTCDDHQGS